ncbi:MAG: branched-chain amino acid ABC transporter substrate-binding protein [Anaerolineales bacterium]
MLRRHLAALLTVAGAAVLLAACGGQPFVCEDALGCVDVAPGDPIRIAGIETISGATAFLGTTNANGARLAFAEINNEWEGHPIEYTVEDSFCNAEGGQAAGAKVSSDPTVIAVIGTTCSGEARAAMPQIAAAGRSMISASNTNPDLTNPDHPDHHAGYFRTAHNDLFQGRVAAEFAYNELGLRSAATVHDGSPYAESLQEVFANTFVELGGTITSQEAVNVGDTDMKPVLTSIAADSPEIIYFPIFEPEGDFMAAQKCEVAGLESTVMMGADGLLTSGFAPASGDCAVGMYMSGPYVSGDAYAAFLDAYNAAYGEGPAAGFAGHAYDAAKIILAALQSVAVVDSDGTVHVGLQALRDAMGATANFQGLTGALTCDENGDCATGAALAVYQVTAAHVSGAEDLLASVPYWTP